VSLGAPSLSAVALREALSEHGGTLAEALADEAELTDSAPALTPPRRASVGPRAGENEAQYELLLEIIREGCLLHYGEPRVVRPADPDLALLLGDQLYALGLTQLAALGDLEAVGELGDTISLLAQAQAVGDPALAEAVWRAGAAAIGWGGTERLQRAKAMARAGDPRAAEALRAAALAVTAGGEGS
jgi:hypothetical protein